MNHIREVNEGTGSSSFFTFGTGGENVIEFRFNLANGSGNLFMYTINEFNVASLFELTAMVPNTSRGIRFGKGSEHPLPVRFGWQFVQTAGAPVWKGEYFARQQD